MSINDTIAQKLATIAANSPRVYAAGEAAGDAAGRQAEYDAFWDVFQKNGTRNQYVSAFAYGNSSDGGWVDKVYNPKYPIYGVAYGLQETFRNNNAITDTKVDLRVAGDGLQTTFSQCINLKRVPRLILEVTVTKTANAFSRCIELEELNIECVNGGCFAASVTFADCSKLNKASIEKIINALSSTITGFTVTLSLEAVNKAFETSAGANDGNTSSEWTALVATKTNWTISLV